NGPLRRPDSQGREARQPAGVSADQVSVRHQPQDGKSARPDRTADTARTRRRGDRMRRREFIAGFGGTVAWPRAARAQQSARVRRVGMLTGLDQSYRAFAAAFREGLSKLGWVEGHNLMTELRFGAADADAIRTYAAELVSLAPDVIVTTTVPATKAVQQQ